MGTKKIESIDSELNGTVEIDSSDFNSIELKPSVKLNSGNYEILGSLGEPGGFGITYLGYNTSLKRKVAIKEYFPRSYANRDSNMTIVPTASKENKEDFEWGYNAFIKEAQLIANLPKHDNVIDVEALFKENGTAYFAMSYEEGKDLEVYLQDKHPMTQKEIENIILPLLEGVKHIHKHDILHRDIKLPNILIKKKDNQPILIDFGTARNQLIQRQKKLTAVYTEGYAALEQHTQSEEGAYTDIYAIGMVIYSMMNGITDTSLLPTAIKRFEVMHSKKISLLSFPDDGRFSKNFINAVKKATEVEVKDRPKNIDELIQLFRGKDREEKKNNSLYLTFSIVVIFILIGVGYFYSKDIPVSNNLNHSTTIEPVKGNIILSEDINDVEKVNHISIPSVKKEELPKEIDYSEEAESALKQGDTEKAISFLKKSVEEDNSLDAYKLGKIYLNRNELKNAIKWFEKSLTLGNDRAKYPLAITLCRKGRFREFKNNTGIIEYAKSANREIKYDVALCYNKMGKVKEAKEWLENSASKGFNPAKEALYKLLRVDLSYSDKEARNYIEKLNKD